MEKNYDWGSMITAQHKASLYQETQEKHYNKLNKQRYKEELDSQLRVKQELNKSKEDYKKLEFLYHQGQVKKFLEFDSLVSKEKRDYIKIFEQDNLAAINKKLIEAERLNKAQKISENYVIENEKNKQEEENFFAAEKKRNFVNKQKSDIEKHLQENEAKKKLAEIEKSRERLLVDWKINDMQKAEIKHQEFMQEKIRLFDEKMVQISKSFVLADPKEKLIQKRQAEHDAMVRSREAEKEANEKYKKIESVRVLRKNLDDQIFTKNSLKIQEKEAGKKYQEVLKREALEAEYFKNLEIFTKNLEKKSIKEEYDKQVLAKRSSSLVKFGMDNREKEINSKILEKGSLVFPSVPGLQNPDPPAKMSFDKIYSKQMIKRDNLRVDSFNIGRGDVYWNNSDLHNPITNPIGDKVPRVMPGQRARRGFRSEPRSQVTIKDIFS